MKKRCNMKSKIVSCFLLVTLTVIIVSLNVLAVGADSLETKEVIFGTTTTSKRITNIRWGTGSEDGVLFWNPYPGASRYIISFEKYSVSTSLTSCDFSSYITKKGTYKATIVGYDKTGRVITDSCNSPELIVDYNTYTIKCYIAESDNSPINSNILIANKDYIMKSYTYTDKDDVFQLEEPSLENYDFLGWSVEGSNIIKNPVEITADTGNKTYIACWQGKRYNVNFDSQGGNEVSAKQCEYASSVGRLPIAIRQNYIFDGWYTAIKDGKRVSDSDKMPAYDVTYYAHWIPVNYFINLYSEEDGETIIRKRFSYTVESENIVLPEVSRAGYIFVGWTGEGITTPRKEVVVVKGTTGKKEYYANWVTDPCADFEHTYIDVITPATTSKNGKIVPTCKYCGVTERKEIVFKISKVKLAATSYIYDGKEKKPTVKVTSSKGDILKKGKDYTLTYRKNKKIGTGTVIITFKGKYKGTLKKTFQIVKGKLSLNYKKLNLKLTDKKKLKCTKSPSKKFSSKIYLKSSNSKVAKVFSNGMVMAKGFGKCTITAYTKEGVEAKCQITVKESDLYLFKNHTFKLSQINGKSYKWKTKNESIAIAGTVVTGISQGKTVIYRKVNGTTYKYNVYITDYEKLTTDAIKRAGDGELSHMGYYVDYYEIYDENYNIELGDSVPVELQPPIVCLVYTSWSLFFGYDYDYEYFKYNKNFEVESMCYEKELNECGHSIRCYQYENFGNQKLKQNWW